MWSRVVYFRNTHLKGAQRGHFTSQASIHFTKASLDGWAIISFEAKKMLMIVKIKTTDKRMQRVHKNNGR